MKKYNGLLKWIVLIVFSSYVLAQEEKSSFIMFETGIGALQPVGRFNERFGTFMTAGFQLSGMIQSKWVAGLNFKYGFTSKVKENTLILLMNEDGFVTNNEGNPADIRITGRMWHLMPEVCYKFPWLAVNVNSGLLLGLGAGYAEHRIKFLDYAQTVAALENNLYKGYDRLSGGIILKQNVGYIFIGSNRLTNFRFDLYFMQHFARNLREINYDLGTTDMQPKWYFSGTLMATWILPLYKKSAEGKYFTD
ncbi:MAG: hypothetical protein N3F09_00850 [Bacteroidia bacterium]|nr:hypothetical protein [Bacteroidia bacterium]